MDKETLSNYGWIVILVLILSVLLALATPFGNFIAGAIKATYAGFGMVGENALGIAIPGAKPDGGEIQPEKHKYTYNDMVVIGDYAYFWTGCDSYEEFVQGEMKGYLREDGKSAATDEERFLMFVEYNYGCTWEELQAEGYTKEMVYNDIATEDDAEYILDVYVGRGGYWDVSAIDKTKSVYPEILTEVDGYPVTHMNSTFYECCNLTNAPAIPNTVMYMRDTFNCCENLETYTGNTDGVGNFNNYKIPSGVIDMEYAFANCDSMVVAPIISHCNKLKNMHRTFAYNDSIIKAPALPNNVEDFNATFENCTALQEAPILSNCSKIDDMIAMFQGCENLCTYTGSKDADGDFSGYILPNYIEYLVSVFSGCEKMTVAPAIPESVTSIRFAFAESGLIATPEMSHLMNLENMLGAFQECKQLTTTSAIPKNAKNISQIFMLCESLTGNIEIQATNLEEYRIALFGVKIKTQNITFSGVADSCAKMKSTGSNY